MLHKLIFDPTDTESRAASANVGAYVRSSDGTLITATGTALDVNIGSVVDLDIRDLDASQDNVAISDGTDQLEINADGSINISDNGGSITVDATDLDIRDLNAATDSIQSNLFDGAGNSIGSTAGALDVNIASGDIDDSLADTALVTGSQSVTTTSADLIATDLASRKWLFAYNAGNKEVYIGPSGVSTANGFPLPPGSALELRAGPSIDIHAVAENGTQDVRTLELS